MKLGSLMTTCVMTDLKVGNIPFFIGDSGIAKSAVAKTFGDKSFLISCNLLGSREDITGARVVPTDETHTDFVQRFFPHERVNEAIDYALAHPDEMVVLVLDEINRTDSDITSGLLSVATERELGHRKFPDNLKIIVTGNDRGNVSVLDEASLTRFQHYRVEPDAAVWLEWMGERCHRWIRAVLTKHPHLISCKANGAGFAEVPLDDEDDPQASGMDLLNDGDEMAQATRPRTLEYLSNWLNEMPEAVLQEMLQTESELPRAKSGTEYSLLEETIEGKVGRTDFTVQLMGEAASELTHLAANAAPQVPAPPKPASWSDLAAAKTAKRLEEIITGLDDDEAADALIYALYDKKKHRRLVEQLGVVVTSVPSAKLGVLTQLAANHMLDRDNVSALVDSGAPIGDTAGACGQILQLN